VKRYLTSLVTSTPEQSVISDYQSGNCSSWQYSAYNGYRHLASGLCCGLSSLAAGLTLGVAGDAGVRANAQKDIYVGVILILIFGEALGLYGLIIAKITPLSGKSTKNSNLCLRSCTRRYCSWHLSSNFSK